MRPRLLFQIFVLPFAVSAIWGTSAGCSNNGNVGGGKPVCNEPRCFPSDGSPEDAYVWDGSAPDAGGEPEASTLDEACGVAPACNPDDSNACTAELALTLPDFDASFEGAPDAEASEAGTALDAAGHMPRACQVSVQGGEPVSACQPSGDGHGGAPCISSGDCAPGLACVGDAYAGQCRPYCCSGPDACAKGSYCAKRAARYGTGEQHEQTLVPVCVVADRCDLSQTFPCSKELSDRGQCTCSDPRTACTVVRGDGTTSCVVPGAAKAGQDCPCAWGYICSQATNKCLKLCSTRDLNPDCSGGKCQGSANLPPDVGVCVGEVLE